MHVDVKHSLRRKTCTVTNDDMQRALADELAQFRSWSYAALAEAVGRTRRGHDHLHLVERISADGTPYRMEFEVFWDDRPDHDVRVCGSLYAEPNKNLLGLVSSPHCTDSIIMGPDGRFVGEDPTAAE